MSNTHKDANIGIEVRRGYKDRAREHTPDACQSIVKYADALSGENNGLCPCLQ